MVDVKMTPPNPETTAFDPVLKRNTPAANQTKDVDPAAWGGPSLGITLSFLHVVQSYVVPQVNSACFAEADSRELGNV